MNTIAFFNNEYSIDKTSLIYHVTYMLAELGHRVLVVDLDSQMQLTTRFLKIEKLQEIYEREYDRPTIIRAVQHLNQKKGVQHLAHIHELSDKIGLIAADPELALFEDKFSSSWSKCLNKNNLTEFEHTLSLYDAIEEASERFYADYTIVNLSSDFTAINRAAFMAIKKLILPVSANVFSLSNIKYIGNKVKLWRNEKWRLLQSNHYNSAQKYHTSNNWIGYVFMQHAIRESVPPSPVSNWGKRVPFYYKSQIINLPNPSETPTFLLSTIRHYHGLHVMSTEFRKPIFSLKPADGAIGSHVDAVRLAYKEYKALTENIVTQINLYTPSNIPT